ncbi:MAG: hypothetical protein DRJ03_26455 [Chloroflexi bacterium]|nr:MAG: hypothetical protein DRI81_15060 [Chloroflexota bacterium]RLC77681.1 MAG: hypothetical protein DRJ03_26455 [Chloroflexota bacterium]
MPTNDFFLSVEETAMAMSIVGQPEEAHSLMAAQLGEMGQEEAHIRLLTAGHSLIARGYLSMDTEGNMHLAEPIAHVARALSRADHTIRYSRSYRNVDLSLAFHFEKKGVFAHRIEQGVVHRITQVSSEEAVIQGGLDFFNLAEIHPFTCPITEISQGLLDQIKDDPAYVVIHRRLTHARVPAETCDLLTEDLSNTQYRGSILRVEYDENNAPISDHGLLVLRGPERLWLLRPFVREGERYVTLLPGTEEAFRREIVTLL